ncbi:acyloxyacyl hydrolase [Telmatospirillum sp.]|uniref:acyloxyacyl hydrolase n=1 Tax=Telmatospirillum sp. TaxID=2079197 RepID=UPI00284F5022|nr:acyloxyacyl hydrolase [Telmatospirillum sp.]MDR3440316.1 acyloxyacyl hydrolase [Telmatospirillum sp.]
MSRHGKMIRDAAVHHVIGLLATGLLFFSSNSLAIAQVTVNPMSLGPVKVVSGEPSYLDLGLGAFNIQEHGPSGAEAEAKIEFRYGQKLFYIGPAIGLLSTQNGAVFGYVGIYSDLKYYSFTVTPLAGVGGYHRGGGEDLGNTFQFRLSLTVSHELDNRSRLGVQFAHISNAGISDINPGDNELLVSYAIPISLP